MNNSALRRPQMRPFGARVHSTRAQLMHTHARVQHPVVVTRDTPRPPLVSIEKWGWFLVNNS